MKGIIFLVSNGGCVTNLMLPKERVYKSNQPLLLLLSEDGSWKRAYPLRTSYKYMSKEDDAFVIENAL